MSINININIKLGILLVLLVSILGIGLWSLNSTKKLQDEKKSFHKLAKELHLIKGIKAYYGEVKTNKKRLDILISKYKKDIISVKEDKGSMEFKIGNLNKDDVNNIVKNLVNKGFKVLQMKIDRASAEKAELSFKVLL